ANPGNLPEAEPRHVFLNSAKFFTDKNIALAANLDPMVARATDFEWDLVSYPVFADSPKLGPFQDAYVMAIHEASQMKEAAFQVLKFLISIEHQKEISEKGIIP